MQLSDNVDSCPVISLVYFKKAIQNKAASSSQWGWGEEYCTPSSFKFEQSRQNWTTWQKESKKKKIQKKHESWVAAESQTQWDIQILLSIREAITTCSHNKLKQEQFHRYATWIKTTYHHIRQRNFYLWEHYFTIICSTQVNLAFGSKTNYSRHIKFE